jgi:hypothetical protein
MRSRPYRIGYAIGRPSMRLATSLSAAPVSAAIRQELAQWLSTTSARSIRLLRDDTSSMDSTSLAVHGQPLISFSFETSKEAEAAHKAMLSIVATAKIITPYALSR